MSDELASDPEFFHVIAIDMDGTLLTPEHEVTTFTKRTLQDVVAKYPGKVFIVLASGRHPKDLIYILDSLELPERSGCVLGCNGARVYFVNTEDALVEKGSKRDEEKAIRLVEVKNISISPEAIREILVIYRGSADEDLNLHIYQHDLWLAAKEEKALLDYSSISGYRYELRSVSKLIEAFDRYKEHAREQFCDPFPSAASGPTGTDGPLDGITKIFISCKNHESLLKFRARLLAVRSALSIAFSSKCFLEIMAEGVSKYTGLQHLMPHFQAYAATRKKAHPDSSIPAQDQRPSEAETPWSVESTVIAFGDNENDVALLTRAARGCLMGNSSDSLKESLKGRVVVVGANTEDGVAHELKRIYKV